LTIIGFPLKRVQQGLYLTQVLALVVAGSKDKSLHITISISVTKIIFASPYEKKIFPVIAYINDAKGREQSQ
jgi:hypothetical protein